MGTSGIWSAPALAVLGLLLRTLTPARSSLVALATTVVVAAGCSSATPELTSSPAADAHELTDADKENDLLFVARAAYGTLTVEADDQAFLSLDDVATMTWFKDRPAHDAGTTTPADALEALGWTGNGSPLGDEPPNAALIAAELGADTPIVELASATIEGTQVSFAVTFIGDERPEPGPLTAIDLFIDDSSPDSTPTGLERSADGIVLGSSSEDPQSPPLTLKPAVADTLDQAMAQDELFAVISGTSTYTSKGEVDLPASSPPASGSPDWRFTLDETLTGDHAPIVVIKHAQGSLTDLAQDPSAWSRAATLNDDVGAAATRLNGIIATVATRAAGDGAYADLHATLTDPSWQGIVIFNASAVVPDQVQDTSTGDLAGTTVPALAVGFTAGFDGPAGPSGASVGPSFGLIDHPARTAGQTPRPGPYVRAGFANAQMTLFDLVVD